MTQRQSLTSSRQQLRRLGAALEAATPSLSSTSLLVEASLEGAAQMERDALGCDGVCVGNGLGLALLGSGLGLELEPNPSMLMEGSMFSQINGL